MSEQSKIKPAAWATTEAGWSAAEGAMAGGWGQPLAAGQGPSWWWG